MPIRIEGAPASLYPDAKNELVGKEVADTPRYVMRKGKVFLEDENGKPRSQWSLLREFWDKSEVLIYTGNGNEKEAVIVPAEMSSRWQGKDKSGEWMGTNQGMFEQTLVLAANLSLYESGQMSAEALSRKYGGVGSVSEIKELLDGNLQMIRNGKLEKPADFEERGKNLVYPRVAVMTEATAETPANVWILPKAQVDKMMDAQEQKAKGKRVRVISSLGAVSLLATACAPVVAPVLVAPVQTGIEPTSAAKTPTTAPTREKTPTVVRTPTEVPLFRGGEYSARQQEIINGVEGQGRIKMCRDAVNWWTSAQNPNRRFDRANVTEIHLFWDDLDTTKVNNFLCAATVTNPQTGAISYYTLDHGDFGNPNGVNLNPMLVSAGDEQHVLMVGDIEGQGLTFTRVGTDGKVSQYVDKRTAQWATPETGLSFEPCADWRTAREQCQVTVDDLLNNRLLDYAKNHMPQFPSDTVKIAFPNYINSGPNTGIEFYPWPNDGSSKETIDWMYRGDWGLNNEVFSGPDSPVHTESFWVKPDGVNLKLPLLVEVIQINAANGVHYLQVARPVMPSTDPAVINETGTAHLFDIWTQTMAYPAPLYDGNSFLKDNEYWLDAVGPLLSRIASYDGSVQSAFNEWQTSRQFPSSLEGVILLGHTDSSTTGPWARK